MVSISVVVAWPDAERLVEDDVLEERDVRLHAADAELAQRAVHALQRDVEASARWP